MIDGSGNDRYTADVRIDHSTRHDHQHSNPGPTPGQRRVDRRPRPRPRARLHRQSTAITTGFSTRNQARSRRRLSGHHHHHRRARRRIKLALVGLLRRARSAARSSQRRVLQRTQHPPRSGSWVMTSAVRQRRRRSQPWASACRADLDAGALGLGTGLEYDPGIFSSEDEIIAQAKIASEAGGTLHLLTCAARIGISGRHSTS